MEQEAAGLSSSPWNMLVEPRETRSKDKSSSDPALYYAAIAGANSDPAGGPQPNPEGCRRAVLIGSSKGPFADWLGRLDRIRQGGDQVVLPPFLPEFDYINQRVVVGITDAGTTKLGKPLTLPSPRGRGGESSIFVNCPVSACSTGLRAVIDAARLIAWDHVDHGLAGSADASIHPLTLAAYAHMGLLSPRGVCEAWAPGADGFFIGEGAGILQLSSEKPVDQKTKTYPWRVVGWISACDPGITNGDPGGRVLRDILTQLLGKAGWTPPEVTAIKPHATGTPLGDAAEQSAVQAIWPDRTGLRVLLPKRQFGHCLGATGALELAWALQELSAAKHNFHPHRLIAWSLGFGGGVEAVALEQLPVRHG